MPNIMKTCSFLHVHLTETHTYPKSLIEMLSNSYTMGCPHVRGDNSRALANGLSYVWVDKHGITVLYHLH